MKEAKERGFGELYIDEILRLVNQRRNEDAINFLETYRAVVNEPPRLHGGMLAKAIEAARACSEDPGANTLSAFFYEVAIRSGSRLSIADIGNIARSGSKSQALRACQHVDGSPADKIVCTAYVLHRHDALIPVIDRWIDGRRVSTSGGEMQIPASLNDDLTLSAKFYQWLNADKLAALSLTKAYERGTERTAVEDELQQGVPKVEERQLVTERHNSQGNEAYKLVRMLLMRWLAAARDIIEGIRCNQEVGPAIPRDWKTTVSGPGPVHRMLSEIYSADDLNTIIHAQVEMFEGELKSASHDSKSVLSKGPALGRQLARLVNSLATGLQGEDRPSTEALEKPFSEMLRVYGLGGLASVAAQIALVTRLLTTGRIERAQAELAVLKFNARNSSLNLDPAIEYFSMAIDLTKAGIEGRSTAFLESHLYFNSMIQNNIFSNMLTNMREDEQCATSSMYGEGLLPAVKALRTLRTLDFEQRYSEYVDYAGHVTDHLISDGYDDKEFIFKIRLKQIEKLENLGRFRHAQRVAKYVSAASNSINLGENITIPARVMWARNLAANGDTRSALTVLGVDKLTSELSAPELYTRSLIQEELGRTAEALRDLGEVLERQVSDSDHALLRTTELSIKARMDRMTRLARGRQYANQGMANQ